MSKKLLKSTGIVSSMTLLSRVLGFVRDVIIALFFGATAGADAFFVAFKIPNFMRRLFAEGAFSQAFVPVLSEFRQQREHHEVRQFVSHMGGVLGLGLVVVTIAAELFAPVIIAVFAPGFTQDETRFLMATDMLRVTFPYLLFISLTAFAGATLNTYSRFAVPAFTPVLLNLSLISASFLLAPHMAEPVTALAWGVFFAGIIQLLFQLPFLARIKLLAWPRWSWRDSGVRRVLKLMLPALFGVSVFQIGVLLDTVFASFLPTGSISWLYYSDRITSLPLGVFAVAIATVVLPYLSRQVANNSADAYSQALDWSLRLVLLVGLPSALGLLLLAGPMLTTLLQYGEFSGYDVLMARQSMMAFAIGVPGFMLTKVLASGFYARQDIRTPVRYAVVALAVNVSLNLALIVPLAHAGLALATSVAAAVNTTLLFFGLRRRGYYQAQAGWVKYAVQLAVANGLMGLFLWWGQGELNQWLNWQWPQRLSHLGGLIAIAIAIYFVSLHVLGLRIRDLYAVRSTSVKPMNG